MALSGGAGGRPGRERDETEGRIPFASFRGDSRLEWARKIALWKVAKASAGPLAGKQRGGCCFSREPHASFITRDLEFYGYHYLRSNYYPNRSMSQLFGPRLWDRPCARVDYLQLDECVYGYTFVCAGAIQIHVCVCACVYAV